MLTVMVRYVDGSSQGGDPSSWRAWRGQGVDRVTVTDPSGVVVFQSSSLYWLYRESGGMVVGRGGATCCCWP